MVRSLPALPLLMLPAVVLAGCTSAEERLGRAREPEDAGQAAQATHRDVQALRKDATLAGRTFDTVLERIP